MVARFKVFQLYRQMYRIRCVLNGRDARLCKYLWQIERRIDVTTLMQFMTRTITKLDIVKQVSESFPFLIVKQISNFHFNIHSLNFFFQRIIFLKIN